MTKRRAATCSTRANGRGWRDGEKSHYFNDLGILNASSVLLVSLIAALAKGRARA
jgi:hypothetical protein